jgi:hypothetical protein
MNRLDCVVTAASGARMIISRRSLECELIATADQQSDNTANDSGSPQELMDEVPVHQDLDAAHHEAESDTDHAATGQPDSQQPTPACRQWYLKAQQEAAPV